jgi:MFS transporter, PHS family, inorganic phosphate transporter
MVKARSWLSAAYSGLTQLTGLAGPTHGQVYLNLFASLNHGPNVTTFVLPQETFPVHVRATLNGVAAAAGKMGAFAGLWIFQGIYDRFGMVVLMMLCACLSLVGVVLTYFFVCDTLYHKQVTSGQKGTAPRSPLP